jgi:hypothetical protein
VIPHLCVPGQPEQCSVDGGAATVKDKKVKWSLSNSGTAAIVLSQVAISWPEANGKLMKIKFDGDVVWDARAAWSATGVTLSTANFTADAKKKRIDPGKTRELVLEFEKNASSNLEQYLVTVRFGADCELTMPNTPPPVAGNFCVTAPGSGRPRTLTMTYVDANGAAAGGNCTTGCNTQDPSKVIVNGDPNLATPVWIHATPLGKTSVLFSGAVSLDGQFVLSAANGGLTTLDTNTIVTIRSSQTGPILSTVTYHTSCSQPLNQGDFYGSLQLIGFSR